MQRNSYPPLHPRSVVRLSVFTSRRSCVEVVVVGEDGPEPFPKVHFQRILILLWDKGGDVETVGEDEPGADTLLVSL